MKHTKMNLHLTINERHSGIKYIEISPFKKKEKKDNIFLLALLYAALSFLFAISLFYAVSISLENEDFMLCESAKKSGNVEYTKRCGCFYEGKNINCINEEGVNNK